MDFRGELKESGPLGFQLIVLNLINRVVSAPDLLSNLTALCPVQLQLESILYEKKGLHIDGNQ
jgi:hypothetical protein